VPAEAELLVAVHDCRIDSALVAGELIKLGVGGKGAARRGKPVSSVLRVSNFARPY